MQDLAQSSSQGFIFQPGQEPIPGYSLVEPLGRGGFGEVWKCVAPGGLFKAIKFVQSDFSPGSSKTGPVEQELEALQRIKFIRHPFILSTERIEASGGLLVIVMELADQNLLDLFQEHRQAGLPGVPRDHLLALLLEGAEALDFLHQRHNLQHLDVKPGNLFLLSNHLKVGDFGLVRSLDQAQHPDDLCSQAGMTPLYVAPERLQGSLSPHCDQYSLAVVYQELLTGTPPIEGKTAIQVTLQHLKGQPNLEPLPAADRPVVARALAKNPDDRFPSCLAFLHALVAVRVDAASRLGAKPPGDSQRDTRQRTHLRQTPRVNSLVSERVKIVPVSGLVGGSIPDHEIVTLRGCGALGEVYQVKSSDGRQRLARFLPLLSAPAETIEEELIQRLADFEHPAIPPTDVFWSPEGKVVIVTDTAPTTLHDRFQECVAQKQPGVPRKELLDVLRQTAAALDTLFQQQGLHHLGLAPGRIQLLNDGVWLTDFGLIEMIEIVNGQTLDLAVSRYSSPELLGTGSRATADSFLLAVIYTEMLTGVNPVPSRVSSRPTGQRRSPPLNLEMLSPAERAIVARALDPDPRKRFATCSDFVQKLAEAGEPERNRPSDSDQWPLVIALEAHVEESSQATLPTTATIVREALTREAGLLCSHQNFQYVHRQGQGLEVRCPIRPVAGLLKLKLKAFAEQCGAQLIGKEEGTFVYRVPTVGSVWQQMFGRPAGLEILLHLPVPANPTAAVPNAGEALIQVRLYGEETAEAQERLVKMGPELLKNLACCLPGVAERRRAMRWPYPHPVRVFPGGSQPRPNQSVEGECRDLSLTGVRCWLRRRPSSDHVYLCWPTLTEYADLAILARIVRERPLDDGRYEIAATWRADPPADLTS